MTRLFLFAKYLLVMLVVAMLGLVAVLAYCDVKYFQPTLTNYNLQVAMPESLPRLLDAASGDALKYHVARIVLVDSHYEPRGHFINAIWTGLVSLHLTKSEQHAVIAARGYVGHRVFGFEQASAHFYSKNLLDITPTEAALLVARLHSPSQAIRSPEKHKERAEDLLSRAGYSVHYTVETYGHRFVEALELSGIAYKFELEEDGAWTVWMQEDNQKVEDILRQLESEVIVK